MLVITEEQKRAIQTALTLARSLPGLKVELVGAWVWVSGDTFPHKETLKAAGFKWASKRKMWTFAGVPSSGKGAPMDYIRAKYGSMPVVVAGASAD